MEDAMSKCLVIAAGTLAILAGSTLAFDRATAGGSSSAPSKYNNAHHVASATQTNRQARRDDFRITEYSSSSANTGSQRQH
jgi:hypothetical protein